MIPVLIDTNVVLDYAEEREGFFEMAKKVFEMIRQREMIGCVSASAVTDIFYFLQRRYRKPGVAMSLLKKLTRLLKILMVNHETIEIAIESELTRLLKILMVNHETIEIAIESDMTDFEDAVQTAAAKDCGIDIVVTRDKEGFRNSGLRVYSPEEFLETLK